jgi:aconitate hydratase
VGDDISTDEILPAGTRVLPYRSNVPEISKFTFEAVDETFHDRAIEYQDQGFFIVGGDNYGQGSSREHAVIAPRYLGLRAVIAKSFARIHWQNLINFGVLPLTFSEPDDASRIEQGDMLVIEGIQDALRNGTDFEAENRTKDERYPVQHALTERQVDVVLKGSLINRVREKSGGDAA